MDGFIKGLIFLLGFYISTTINLIIFIQTATLSILIKYIGYMIGLALEKIFAFFCILTEPYYRFFMVCDFLQLSGLYLFRCEGFTRDTCQVFYARNFALLMIQTFSIFYSGILQDLSDFYKIFYYANYMAMIILFIIYKNSSFEPVKRFTILVQVLLQGALLTMVIHPGINLGYLHFIFILVQHVFLLATLSKKGQVKHYASYIFKQSLMALACVNIPINKSMFPWYCPSRYFKISQYLQIFLKLIALLYYLLLYTNPTTIISPGESVYSQIIWVHRTLALILSVIYLLLKLKNIFKNILLKKVIICNTIEDLHQASQTIQHQSKNIVHYDVLIKIGDTNYEDKESDAYLIGNNQYQDHLIPESDESNADQCCKNKYCKEIYQITLAAQRKDHINISFYFDQYYQECILLCKNMTKREMLLPTDINKKIKNVVILNCFKDQPNTIMKIYLDRIEKGNYRGLSLKKALFYFWSYERSKQIIEIFSHYQATLLSLNAYEKIQKPLMTFSPQQIILDLYLD